MRRTGLSEYATSFLICSKALAVRKQAGDTAKAFLPVEAKPAATPTKFCSAMPTSTIWVGYFLPKGTSLPDPLESLVITTTLRSPVAKCCKVAENTSKFGLVTCKSSVNTFPIMFMHLVPLLLAHIAPHSEHHDAS